MEGNYLNDLNRGYSMMSDGVRSLYSTMTLHRSSRWDILAIALLRAIPYWGLNDYFVKRKVKFRLTGFTTLSTSLSSDLRREIFHNF